MTTATMRRRHPERPIWEEEPGPVGKGLKGVALTAIALAVVFPMWVVLVTSLSPERVINEAGGLVIIPGELSLRAYEQILSGGTVTRAVLVSTGVTIVGTVFSVVLSVLAAYGLSRRGSVLHRPLLFVFLLTFLFGPGLVPSYLMVTGLGLKDNYWALILPTAINAFNLVVLRAFFMAIPQELLDSARIDGAGEVRILTRIVLPLSKAVTAVVALFYAVGYWNAFFNAVLYIDDNSMSPLQIVLRSMVLQGTNPTGFAGPTPGTAVVAPNLAIKMAVVMLAVIPALLVFPFVQRHFTKGVITGAVKG